MRPLSLKEEPHQETPSEEKRPPPRLEGQERHEADNFPLEIRDVFQGTLHNRKHQVEASDYFNSLSRKLQHLDVFHEEGYPTTQ